MRPWRHHHASCSPGPVPPPGCLSLSRVRLFQRTADIVAAARRLRGDRSALGADQGVVGRVGVIALAVLALLLSLSVLRPGAASAAAAEHTIDAPTTAEVGQKVDPGEQATVSVARVDAAGRMRVDSYPVTGPEGAVSAIAEARSDPAAVAADVAQPITPLATLPVPGAALSWASTAWTCCASTPSLAGNAFAGQPPCADDAQAHASGRARSSRSSTPGCSRAIQTCRICWWMAPPAWTSSTA